MFFSTKFKPGRNSKAPRVEDVSMEEVIVDKEVVIKEEVDDDVEIKKAYNQSTANVS